MGRESAFLQEIERGKGRYNGGGKEEKKMDETLKTSFPVLGARRLALMGHSNSIVYAVENAAPIGKTFC